ncbi:MAG TPA: 50S ribosomal protein L11 methyltransferase [Polyangiaceae bacterium]|nr:50S ribosomal protein L11 methyltransferase [Polyangiaceae bacterium]
MQRLSIRVDPADADLVSGCLFEAGASGIEEQIEAEATALVVYADDPSELERLRERLIELLDALPPLQRRPAFELTTLDPNFGQAWLDYLKPERLTNALVIQPVSSPEPSADMRVLRYYPELAFGTGSHPTTRLAASAVEELVSATPGEILLDVGTGNGVLAMVGLVSGAREALGIDIDANALRAAAANAELNGLGARARFSTLSLAELDESFPLVVANIDAPTLVALARALAERTEKTLLVTGVLAEQCAEVEASFKAAGLELRERRELEDWCLLRFEPALTKSDRL